MKKTLFILSLMMIVFASCTNENENVKKCWEFTITQVSESTFMGETMTSEPVVTTLTECGMTETEAKAAVAEMDGVVTQTMDGISVKVTTTVTYKEVAEE